MTDYARRQAYLKHRSAIPEEPLTVEEFAQAEGGDIPARKPKNVVTEVQ